MPLTLITYKFAIDTIIFSCIDYFALRPNIIKIFEQASGLNINYENFELSGLNCESSRDLLACLCRCERGSRPSSYLGLPLNGNHRSPSFCSPIIANIEKKPHNWNHSFSVTGCQTDPLPNQLSPTSLFTGPYVHIPHVY